MTRGAVIDGQIFDAQREAERLRSEAEEDARRERERAEGEARRLRDAAVAEGLAAGRAEAAAELVRLRRTLEVTGALERDLATLGVRVAERILGRALELDPALVVDLVRAALAELRRARLAVVRVHPDDVAVIERALPRLAAAASGAELRILPDAEIAHGGCVVEAGGATVDARVETQLARLEAALGERGP